MNVRWLAGLLLAVTTSRAYSQTSTTPGQTRESVLAAEIAGCRAYEHNDAAGIRRFLADDYTLTDSKGTVTTKQDDIDDAEKHRIHYTTFRNRDMKVRLYPGTAIVTGRTLVAGTAAGKPFDVEVQFTDTLVWIDGRWVLVAGHVSRIRDHAAA